MYRAFKLSIDEEIIQDDIFHGSIVIGKNLMISEKADIENLLREVFVNGTIDGTALADRYFHTFK